MRNDEWKRFWLHALLLAALGFGACSDSEEDESDAATRADAGEDAEVEDPVDAGEDAEVEGDGGDELDAEADPDAAAPDAAAPDAGLPPLSRIASLVNESAADYAHNRWGLIEAATLATYASTWGQADTAPAAAAPNGRPAHLAADAKLIVLQLNAANRAAGENYVPSQPAQGVYTYELDAFRFNEVRDTGLISNSVRYQASGATTDAWLARYGIDLSKDFVVFAAGENTAANGGFFQDLARGVYWLRYWGASIQQLAIVNGTLQQNYSATLSSNKTPESAISNGGFSVAALRADNTALTLPLESFLAIVDANLAAPDVIDGFGQQWIIDARPTAQYDRTTPTGAFHATHPGQFITTGWSSSGAPSADATGQAKSYVPVEGHVKGAVSFPWASLLADAGGGNFKYKDKATLAGIFQTAGYAPSDKSSKVVVSQCRTNFEVQVNGFAALNLLGYPTVYFDGSLVEYASLVSNHPDASLNLAPSDPAYKFRTDTPARIQYYAASANSEAPSTTESDQGVAPYNVANGAGPADRKVAQAVIRRSATTTRLALDADREYKRK